MIYLLDEKLTDDSHSSTTVGLIRRYTCENICLKEIHKKLTIGDIYRTLILLFDIIQPSDIIFCPWAIQGNLQLDKIFYELAEHCWVVASAGNNGKLIENYTPARVSNVITVGSLNKSGIKASHSNYSELKVLEWVIGTNIIINNKAYSGTSVSSAIYTAFLAEALRLGNFSLVNTYIEEITKQLMLEPMINNDNQVRGTDEFIY